MHTKNIWITEQKWNEKKREKYKFQNYNASDIFKPWLRISQRGKFLIEHRQFKGDFDLE